MTYTLDDLCKRWNLSDDTIRRRIKARQLRTLPRPPRGAIRIDESEVFRHERRAVKSHTPGLPPVPDELGLYARSH
jgi:DeoR/GlpR family transcriptional regulator of sugar metabolism